MDKSKASVELLNSAFRALNEGRQSQFRGYMLGFALVNDQAFMPTREAFLAGCRMYARQIAYAVASGMVSSQLLEVMAEDYQEPTVFVLLPEGEVEEEPSNGFENE